MPKIGGGSASAPLAIQKVSVSPKELQLDQGGSAAIQFEITQAAQVAVDIRNEVGAAVRSFDLGSQPAGPMSVRWDGQDSSGARILSGVYLYRIRATGSDGQRIISEPAVPGGNEVLAQQFTLDPDTGAMRFLLPQASRVRLRVGLRGYPLLRTLYDWTPMLAGPHEIAWDGRDATGQIQLSHHPNLDVNLSAFALPGNSILATGNGELGRGPAGIPADVPAGAYMHASHPPEQCHEPKLRLEVVGPKAKSRSGLPVVSGTVPIRVTLDPNDAEHLVNARFEVMLFVDTVFLFEAEEGSNPFTYSFDTSSLAPGRHLFTVNVLGYDDHTGTQTIELERAAGGPTHGE
jgi:hypothetical protein